MGYMDRAMKAQDPRYRRVLEKLGYGRRDMQAEKPPEPEPDLDIADVRAEYERIVGKRPFNGWDIPTLKRKMSEAAE